MIPRRNLSLISNELLKEGGVRIPERTIELDYALAWFLVEMANDPYRDNLAFKGGTALRRCHLGEYRFSEDLDFTLLNDDAFEPVQAAFSRIAEAASVRSGLAMSFSRPDKKPHANSHTFYMSFTGPLGAEREFKVDVTRSECIVEPLVELPVLRTYDLFDLPQTKTLKVYSIPEIVAEKLVALTDKARTEPRDLFDLWHLVSEAKVDLSETADAIAQKLRFRGRGTEGLANIISNKERRLGTTWETRLRPQMARLPPFDRVMREIGRELRQAELWDKVVDSHRRLG